MVGQLPFALPFMPVLPTNDLLPKGKGKRGKTK